MSAKEMVLGLRAERPEGSAKPQPSAEAGAGAPRPGVLQGSS